MDLSTPAIKLEAPGATRLEWQHFSEVLDLAQELLPVVANLEAPISPESKLRELGKVPSRYNARRQVAGIANWTHHFSTDEELAQWSREPDYAIGMQARTVRALDVDISDPQLACEVNDLIARHVQLPLRVRANSPKFLAAFLLPGEYPKRTIATAHGMIEFLGDGQQWVCAGRHKSGVRYEWCGGLPSAFPVLTGAQFEALFADLQARFGIKAAVVESARVRERGQRLQLPDAAADFIRGKGLALDENRDGALVVRCPWEDQHTTGETGDGSTVYFPAGVNGRADSGFECRHAHCADKHRPEFLEAIGFAEDMSGEFEDLQAQERAAARSELDAWDLVGGTDARAAELAGKLEPAEAAEYLKRFGLKPKRRRFEATPIAELRKRPRVQWLVKHVLPKGEVGMLFGPSGVGKSFVMIDLALAIARGVAWRDRKVEQARVAYVVAEGRVGLWPRLEAYERQHGVSLDPVPFAVHDEDVPNLLKNGDAAELGTEINATGGAALIVLDTLAQVTPGANENSSEDMGRALQQCKLLARATGALVMIVHHSGKDLDKGARGWSGLKGAMDVEIEVQGASGDREIRVSKIKDGPPDQRFGFRVRELVLSVDEDGDDEVSCVVEHTNVLPVRRRRLGKQQRTVLDIAKAVLASGAHVALVDLVDKVANEIPFDPLLHGKRDKRRDTARRVLPELVDGGALEITSDGFVVLPKT